MGSCSCWLNSFETLLKHLNTLNIYINKSLKPSHLRSQRYNIVSTTATWTERPIHASPPQFRNCFRNNEQTLVSVLGKENSSSALLSVISNWQFCYVLPFTSSSSLSAALPQLSIFLTLSSLFWSSMAFSNTYVTTHSNTHTHRPFCFLVPLANALFLHAKGCWTQGALNMEPQHLAQKIQKPQDPAGDRPW